MQFFRALGRKSLWVAYARLSVPMVAVVASCALFESLSRLGWATSLLGDRSEWAVGVLILTTSAGYVWIARVISRLIVIREQELYASVLLYAAIAVLLLLHCVAYGWSAYDLFMPVQPQRVTRADAIYFSAATFTTLGYGDFVPRAGAGRALAAFEALLGISHSVFFILGFLRGGMPTRPSQGPADSVPP